MPVMLRVRKERQHCAASSEAARGSRCPKSSAVWRLFRTHAVQARSKQPLFFSRGAGVGGPVVGPDWLSRSKAASSSSATTGR